MALLILAAAGLRRQGLLPAARLPLVRLKWAADGTWRGWNAAGQTVALSLAPASMNLGSLVLLVLRAPGARFVLAVSAATSGERPFRALKRRLMLDRHRPADMSC